jgi:hypothetical protein
LIAWLLHDLDFFMVEAAVCEREREREFLNGVLQGVTIYLKNQKKKSIYMIAYRKRGDESRVKIRGFGLARSH